MIDGEVAVLPNPQDVEGGGHGAFAGRQDRSHGQELGFAPGPGVKQVLKGQQQDYYDCGQGGHTRPLLVIWSSLPCSYNLSSFCTKSRFQPRQWNISVGQPQHEVRRFGHVSKFYAKSSERIR